MKNLLDDERYFFDACIKSAQYIATLVTHKDFWISIEKIIKTFFNADIFFFIERGVDGKIIEHQHTRLNSLLSKKVLEKSKESITQILENGFIASELINTPDPYAIAFLPISKTNQIIGVMVIGHQRSEPLPKYILNTYLALAGIVETTIEKLSRVDELINYRNQLEELVKDLRIVNIKMIQEIAERKRAEADLSNEKERLDITLQSIGEGMISTDTDGKIVLMNKVAEKLTCWTQKDSIGKPINEVYHIINEKTREHCENSVEKVLKTGAVVGLANSKVLVTRTGTERFLEDSGAPIRDKDGNIIGVILVFRDVTEKRKVEEELQKIQKLESIGILAGGIAHDFNNLLTSISCNISLVKQLAQPRDKVFERLTEAEKAITRANDLTYQLLTFSLSGAHLKKTACISELLKDTISFALSGSIVKCEFSLPKELWLLEIDEGQISQVIQNIVINADQAMPEGGIIEVSAANVAIEAKDEVPLEEGNYVKITIKDHGIGILKEHLLKIFDPFFTTKQKGSGLGLAISYSIVKNHDGYIDVESQIGIGSTFSFYLPAAQEQISEKKEGEKAPIAGSGNILVMDDEDVIRECVEELLTHLGYQVELVKNGEEAIALYKAAQSVGQSFDLLILDLTIRGGMGGKETIKKLLEIDPNVKALVSSGYSTDPAMSNFRKYGFCGVITKPYNIEELSKILYQKLCEKT